MQNKQNGKGDVSAPSTTTETEKFDPDEWEPNKVESSDTVNRRVGKVLGAIRNFGIIVSVISFMIIGVKTMVGSINDKAEYIESLPSHIIGVFILLACTTIPSIIYNIASNF